MKELLYNGKIITMEDHVPRAESVLIDNGLIKKVGKDSDFHNIEDELVNKTNLEGKVLMPGFAYVIKFSAENKSFLEECMDGNSGEKIESCLRSMVNKEGITTLILINVTKKQYEVIKDAAKNLKEILDIVVFIRFEEAVNMLERFVMPNIKYVEGMRIAGCSLALDEYTQEEMFQKMSICMGNNWQMFGINGKVENLRRFCECYVKVQELEQCEYRQRPIAEVLGEITENLLDEFNVLEIYPYFRENLYSNGEYYFNEKRENMDAICPFKSMVMRGIEGGVLRDFSKENTDNIIMKTISDMVNRVSKTGRIIGENEKISIPSALDIVTKNMHYNIFEEKLKGTISVGKKAKFVIMDRSPFEVRKDEIKEIKVVGVVNI